MQNKIQNIHISYWYQELDYNPKDKIENLEKEVKSVIDQPLLYNEELPNRFIGMPRIQGMSSDNKYLFNMSLINANLTINVSDLSSDDVILLINEKVQLFFDILHDVYNLDIIYTSIKLELISDNKLDYLKDMLKLKDNHYEDLSFKRGFCEDEYYINYLINSGKEYNFNIKRDSDSLSEDLYNRTLLVSLSDAKLSKEFIVTVIEINDRYAYNLDNTYHTSKEMIRGMILKIKEILNKELYNEIYN